MEEWKQYKGLIEISNYGNARTLDRVQEQKNRWGKTMMVLHKGSDLKPSLSKKTGYYKITINNGKEKEYQNIHRLVALLFCEIPEHLKSIPLSKLHVDHLDGDKTNNVWTNLEWKTPKENTHNPVTFEKWKEIIKTKEYRERLQKALIDRNWHPSDETKLKMRNSALGRKLTEEQKSKMSSYMKERLKDPKNHPMYGRKGENNPLYGKHLNDEHKAKISEALKGKIVSEETRQKFRNRIITDEQRKKMSLAKKGKLGNRRIEVVQLTLSGEFVAEHPSGCVNGFCQSAISACCRGKQTKHKGFKWMYKTDYDKMINKEITTEQVII